MAVNPGLAALGLTIVSVGLAAFLFAEHLQRHILKRLPPRESSGPLDRFERKYIYGTRHYVFSVRVTAVAIILFGLVALFDSCAAKTNGAPGTAPASPGPRLR
jgi:hypothetical protein